MNDVLFVDLELKEIIPSIAQLTRDNNYGFYYVSLSFVIKDLCLGNILLDRPIKENLHAIPTRDE